MGGGQFNSAYESTGQPRLIVQNVRYPIPPEIIAYAATVSRNERINEMDEYDPQTLKISMVLKDGVSRENYLKFFHYVLWLEERHKSQQLKQTKLCGVKIDEIDNGYVLFIDEDKQENLNLRAGEARRVMLDSRSEKGRPTN
ncbi:unnamed protein product, partial [Iphiclides podalirius]